MAFYTREDIPKKQYPYDDDAERRDWFVGSIKRFKYIVEWVEQDDITDFMYIEKNFLPRIEIRKWCEENCRGDVLAIDKTNTIYSIKHGFQVRRDWIVFHFEYEEDALAFKLRWM